MYMHVYLQHTASVSCLSVHTARAHREGKITVTVVTLEVTYNACLYLNTMFAWCVFGVHVQWLQG